MHLIVFVVYILDYKTDKSTYGIPSHSFKTVLQLLVGALQYFGRGIVDLFGKLYRRRHRSIRAIWSLHAWSHYSETG